MPPNQRYTYFTDQEVVGLDAEFVAKLDIARKVSTIPYRITSGLRTPETNKSIVGAVPDSAHIKGLAVDLAVDNSHEVWQIVEGLMSAGINRIGIYTNSENIPIHLHCDVDPDKVPEVIFIKREGQAKTPPVTV